MPDDVRLSLALRKSAGKTDEFGNYIFEVEASNENLDLQNQIVLQNALLESRDEFLRNGVISYDHLHKRKGEDGSAISDPAMVIGEPIDVKTDGSSTIVVGKLYSTNEKAKEIIKLLKAGSTRIKASVGGIFPKIVKDAKTGVEKVVHVLWNDLALTVSPVNSTVGSAGLAKALSPCEFVSSLPEEMKKALAAGYGTDSAEMEGGRALIGEDAQAAVAEATAEQALDEQKAIDEVIRRLRSRAIKGSGQAEAFLVSAGIGGARAREIVREILEQGEQMKKGLFKRHISSLLKSLPEDMAADGDEMEDEDELDAGKPEVEEEEEVEKAEGGEEELEDSDFDDEDEGFEGDEGEEDEDEEAVEGGELVKSLSAELRAVRKSQRLLREELRAMKNTQDNLARVLVDTAQAVQRIGSEPMSPKSVLNKSLAKGQKKAAAPSRSDLDTVNEILVKAVKDGRLDIFKSCLISGDFQKSMATGKPMRKEFYDFLQAEYAAGRN